MASGFMCDVNHVMLLHVLTEAGRDEGGNEHLDGGTMFRSKQEDGLVYRVSLNRSSDGGAIAINAIIGRKFASNNVVSQRWLALQR